MSRPSAFDDDNLNLAQFAPKRGAPKGDNTPPAPPAELIRQVADAAGFPSRAAQPFVPRREPMTYGSGRTAVFSAKTLPDTLDAFYRIARVQGWKVGETFERAVEALRREVEGEGT